MDFKNIFSKKELHARYEVALENYIKKLEIEAQILEELINTHVVPSAVDYLAKISSALTGLSDSRFATSKDGLANRAGVIANHLTALETEFAAFHKAKASVGHQPAPAHAAHIAAHYPEHFNTIRAISDELEVLVDDSVWKLPKYRELFFVK